MSGQASNCKTSFWPDWCEQIYQVAAKAGSEQDSSFGRFRQEALVALKKQGLPRTSREEWKYTDLAFLQSRQLRPIESLKNVAACQEVVRQHTFEGSLARLVFIDGILCEAFSNFPSNGSGVTIFPLLEEENVDRGSGSVANKFDLQPGQFVSFQSHPFVALNTVACQQCWAIVFDSAARSAAPLHIIHVANEKEALSNPRLLIAVQSGAEATFAETFVNLNGNPSLANAVSEISLDDGARLNYAKYVCYDQQASHIAFSSVRLAADAVFDASLFSFGGQVVRNELHVKLDGQKACANLRGLTLLDQAQQVDNQICVEHSAVDTTSNQLFKGIYNHQARGVFSGTIVVQPQAQQTAAFQSCQTLLLSDQARIEARPQLKIWADNVRCSHGATVGQLDDNAIFYLRSRGISEQAARRVLLEAFAQEVVNACDHQILSERAKFFLTGLR